MEKQRRRRRIQVSNEMKRKRKAKQEEKQHIATIHQIQRQAEKMVCMQRCISRIERKKERRQNEEEDVLS